MANPCTSPASTDSIRALRSLASRVVENAGSNDTYLSMFLFAVTESYYTDSKSCSSSSNITAYRVGECTEARSKPVFLYAVLRQVRLQRMVSDLLITSDRSSELVDLSKQIRGILEAAVCHSKMKDQMHRLRFLTVDSRISIFLLIPLACSLVALACVVEIASLDVNLCNVLFAVGSLSEASSLGKECHCLRQSVHSIC